MSTHALLVSSNDLLIHEFEKYSAVTETPLIATAMPTEHQINNAHHVFIDSRCEIQAVEHALITLVVIGETSPATWQLAVTHKAGHVAVLPEGQGWIIEHFPAPLHSQSFTIGLIPAIGGAGASTIASALSVQACENFGSVALIDLDRTSAGLDIVCGAEEIDGLRWDDIGSATGVIRGEDLQRALPIHDGVHLLSWKRDSLTQNQQLSCPDVIGQLSGVFDLMVLDFGAHEAFDDQLTRMLNQAIVVVPNTVRGCASAARRIGELNGQGISVGLVVREIPGSHLKPIEVSESLGAPLLTRVATDLRVVEQIEQGMGPGLVNLGGFTRSIFQLLESLSIKELSTAA